MNDEQRARLESLRAQIAGRLKPLCEQWPPEMFEEMVRGLAAITLKYELQGSTYDPQPTDLLVAEMKELADRSAKLRERGQQLPETPASEEPA